LEISLSCSITLFLGTANDLGSGSSDSDIFTGKVFRSSTNKNIFYYSCESYSAALGQGRTFIRKSIDAGKTWTILTKFSSSVLDLGVGGDTTTITRFCENIASGTFFYSSMDYSGARCICVY
jgi:hypothetical protein